MKAPKIYNVLDLNCSKQNANFVRRFRIFLKQGQLLRLEGLTSFILQYLQRANSFNTSLKCKTSQLQQIICPFAPT